ncbi:MAG: AMP-binding protein [Microvirga sp.]
MNLQDLFAVPRHRSPDKAALRFEGRTLSYGELFAAADRVAAGLRARGLAPGDRIAFFLGNRPEFVIALLAALRLGAVVVPMNLAYRRREILHILGDAEPRLLLSELSQEPVLEELAPGERPELILAEDLEALAGDPGPWPLVDGSDLAMLLYTSGTTGKSKGAEITHDNVLATVTGLLAAWDWGPWDRLLLTLPLFHTHGLVVGLHCALAAGATVHLRRRFEARDVAAGLLAREATLFFGVPTMYGRLIEELHKWRDPGGRLDLSGVRLFCSGSAPLSAETFAAFRELTGHEILERYGMTETGMNTSNPYERERIAGTVGLPLPGVEIRVADPETGTPVGTDEIGMIEIRGPNVFKGYWRMPEKTAAEFREDGFFISGDLGKIDAQGYVHIVGRGKDLIITGGYNVYPKEVESEIDAIDGVVESAVIGLAHPDFGEGVTAVVVKSGEAALTEKDVLGRLETRLAKFKLPKQVIFVDDLPRNTMGKVQKNILRDTYGTLYAQVARP